MKTFHLSGLQVRVTLLILLTMVPVIGMAVAAYVQERELVLGQIRGETQMLSAFASGTQERFLQTTHQLLTSLSVFLSNAEFGPEGCRTELKRIMLDNLLYSDIGVALPDGTPFCSAAAGNSQDSYAGEPWFQAAANESRSSFNMSSRATKNNRPAFCFGHPVLNRSGNLRFVVFVVIDQSLLHQMAFQMQLPGAAEFFMVSGTGDILTYLQDPEKVIGALGPDNPLVKEVISRGRGDIEIEGLDGARRLYSFTPLSSTVETSLFVAIGMRMDAAYSQANEALTLRLGVLGVIFAITLAIVWKWNGILIVRRVTELSGSIQRLLGAETGNRSHPRHSIDELDSLGEACEKMADTLKEVKADLQIISAQLLSTEERERQKIAADLHDTVAQTLALSRMKLGLLNDAVLSSEFSQSVQEIRKLVQEATREIRSLIHGMDSPVLKGAGIEAALEWLVADTRKKHPVDIRCESQLSGRQLDENVASILFRAASELLVNAVKHAEASQIRIRVWDEGDLIRISVTDDGKGFDCSSMESHMTHSSGFGIMSIRDRLRGLRGSLQIESQSGKGTQVTINVPVMLSTPVQVSL